MTSITTSQLNSFLLSLAIPTRGSYTLTPGPYTLADNHRTGTLHLTITSHTSLTLHINLHPSPTPRVDFLTVLLPGLQWNEHFDVHAGCKGAVACCSKEVKGEGEPVVLVAGEGMEVVVFRYEGVECRYRIVVSGIGNLPVVLRAEMGMEGRGSNVVRAS